MLVHVDQVTSNQTQRKRCVEVKREFVAVGRIVGGFLGVGGRRNLVRGVLSTASGLDSGVRSIPDTVGAAMGQDTDKMFHRDC